MTAAEFEDAITAAVRSLPHTVRRALANVDFVVEDETRAGSPVEREVRTRGGTLLGLYQGTPLARRTQGYTGALPDKITIFRSTIERLAGFDDARVRELVAEVVRHEIAHHLGFGEAEVRRLEKG